MAAPAEIVNRYFKAVNDHDLAAVGSLWSESGVDRFVGQQDVVGPAGVRGYFAELFDAFPDFALDVLELVPADGRVAGRWRARGTFAGPGKFQGFEPNGAQIEIEGCDVITVEGDLIRHNDAYVDSGGIARQLGFLPAKKGFDFCRGVRVYLANLNCRIWRVYNTAVHKKPPNNI